MGAHEILEHSEHISHAGHGHDHGAEGHGKDRLGTYVGITMAVLGVLLAFCAAKVGGERTELVQSLVEQQNAHSKYQAQNIKHRMAFLDLQAVHALAPGGTASLDKKDMAMMARSVERYFEEAEKAQVWVEAFDPVVEAHVEAQEQYETAQLFAEIGIVVASVALLLKKRIAWFAALLLGVLAIGRVGITYAHTSSVVGVAEHSIEEKGKAYRELRNADKTTTAENELVEEIRRGAGVLPGPQASAVPAPGAPKGE